jgi:signal peptidase I
MKRGDNKLKKFLKRFWEIVWKDDSFKGWLISLIFIFIAIKFIFFPILNLATGTTLPLAIVESCSMYHSGNLFSNFDEWWERHESKYSSFNIDKTEFQDFPLKRGFSKGDIIFIIRAKPEKLEVGDIIIFNSDQRNPIIHRVIRITEEEGEYIFSTVGDNNNGQLNVEISISEDQLVGKAVMNLFPVVGWAKLVFYEHIRPSYEKGFCDETGK